MSLPVVAINIDYESEKGELDWTITHVTPLLKRFYADVIRNFLSTFVAQEKDLARAIGDVDLANDSELTPRGKGLTYMSQLVRINISDAHLKP